MSTSIVSWIFCLFKTSFHGCEGIRSGFVFFLRRKGGWTGGGGGGRWMTRVIGTILFHILSAIISATHARKRLWDIIVIREFGFTKTCTGTGTSFSLTLIGKGVAINFLSWNYVIVWLVCTTTSLLCGCTSISGSWTYAYRLVGSCMLPWASYLHTNTNTHTHTRVRARA